MERCGRHAEGRRPVGRRGAGLLGPPRRTRCASSGRRSLTVAPGTAAPPAVTTPDTVELAPGSTTPGTAEMETSRRRPHHDPGAAGRPQPRRAEERQAVGRRLLRARRRRPRGRGRRCGRRWRSPIPRRRAGARRGRPTAGPSRRRGRTACRGPPCAAPTSLSRMDSVVRRRTAPCCGHPDPHPGDAAAGAVGVDAAGVAPAVERRRLRRDLQPQDPGHAGRRAADRDEPARCPRPRLQDDRAPGRLDARRGEPALDRGRPAGRDGRLDRPDRQRRVGPGVPRLPRSRTRFRRPGPARPRATRPSAATAVAATSRRRIVSPMARPLVSRWPSPGHSPRQRGCRVALQAAARPSGAVQRSCGGAHGVRHTRASTTPAAGSRSVRQ